MWVGCADGGGAVRVKMILPALTEAKSPFWRPIKYSLFPPLGLATLAGYLDPSYEITIQDEHVEVLDLNDAPDIVVIQVYITSAYRAYQIADHYRSKGAHVCLGGLHVTSLPEEAAGHADTLFIGPGEDTWPAFLADYRRAAPRSIYTSITRTLAGLPPIRRDLIQRHLYLVPNSIVVSRGCPHHCDFCYKDNFFTGGTSFYTQTVDDALSEISRLPGRHLYFLDDHLFGNVRFASALFDGMRGMGRLWQAAGTVQAILRPGLLEKAAACGLRSLFVGFETLSPSNLQAQHKGHNLNRDYGLAIRRLHDLGVMVNASFVFGMDDDDQTVFQRTVEWAIRQGGEAGYRRAYQDFYRWGSILRGASTKPSVVQGLRHFAYAAGWKKFEPLWDWVIRARRVWQMLPMLDQVLHGFSLDSRYKEKPCEAPTPARPERRDGEELVTRVR